MLKGQSIIGKKVLSRMDGQRLDSVKDIVISRDHSHIVALILEEGGLFSPASAVAFENVVSFGKDAIVITDSKTVTRVEHFPAVKEIMDDRDSLVGKQVFTEAGEQMGKIDDIYFDESNGAVQALQVVGRIVPTVRNGSAQLGISDIVSIGPDAVIINLAAVPKLTAQVGGNDDRDDDEDAPEPAPVPQPAAPLDLNAGLQTGSVMPDMTFDSGAPLTSDATQTLPNPSTSQLESSTSDEGTEAMGAGDDTDEGPRVMGRLSDPTTGDQG